MKATTEHRHAATGTAESLVFCETHPGAHTEAPDCRWPHYVGPAGREPKVGHPYRATD